MRESAEAEAAQIIGDAEQQAQEIVGAALRDAAVAPERPTLAPEAEPDLAPIPGPPPATVVDLPETTLDLTAVERDEERRIHPSSRSFATAPRVDTAEDEQYFAYLRGALRDDQPLGPRFD